MTDEHFLINGQHMKLSQFKYKLPDDRIALYPADCRDESRLLVLHTYDRQVTITHRVTKITLNEDGKSYTIELQGDNINSDAKQLTQVINTADTEGRNYVIGKVIWENYAVGSVVSGLQRVTKAFVTEE